MTVEYRGTSNTNDRGSAETRRKRKAWLFEIWGADVDVLVIGELLELEDAFIDGGIPMVRGKQFPYHKHRVGVYGVAKGLGHPAVRCFRCGDLLTWESVEVDRIKPGCEGGRYLKSNIRPVCAPCNKILSGEYVKRRNAARKRRNEMARARRASVKRMRTVTPAPMTLAAKEELTRSLAAAGLI